MVIGEKAAFSIFVSAVIAVRVWNIAKGMYMVFFRHIYDFFR